MFEASPFTPPRACSLWPVRTRSWSRRRRRTCSKVRTSSWRMPERTSSRDSAVRGSCSVSSRMTADSRAAGSTIESHGSLPANALPARERHLHVDRVDLHRVAAGASPLGGDERCPRAAERLVERIACLQVIADRGLEQHERLLGWVVEPRLGAPAHDHLGGGHPPDCRLVARSTERELGARPPDDPAGLMRPLVPRAPDREESLVPDHLAHDLEADPLEALGHLRRMDTRMPVSAST